MIWFNTAKRYHEMGFYTKEDVAKFVMAGKITEAQYTEITGDAYPTQA